MQFNLGRRLRSAHCVAIGTIELDAGDLDLVEADAFRDLTRETGRRERVERPLQPVADQLVDTFIRYGGHCGEVDGIEEKGSRQELAGAKVIRKWDFARFEACQCMRLVTFSHHHHPTSRSPRSFLVARHTRYHRRSMLISSTSLRTVARSALPAAQKLRSRPTTSWRNFTSTSRSTAVGDS